MDSGSREAEASTCIQQPDPNAWALMLEEERKMNKELMDKLLHLEERVQQLEQTSPENLARQVDAVVHHGGHVASGPDTPDHFHDFSLDKVVLELQELAPDTYKAFMQLGNVHRHLHHDSEVTATNEIKAITFLCTRMNARSSRAKGIQLLLSMMLIARSTSKQVHSII